MSWILVAAYAVAATHTSALAVFPVPYHSLAECRFAQSAAEIRFATWADCIPGPAPTPPVVIAPLGAPFDWLETVVITGIPK